MELTLVERWMLYNQAKILENMYPEDGYDQVKKILLDGYKPLYEHCIQYFEKSEGELSQIEYDNIMNTLSMFRAIHGALSTISDKEGLNITALTFQGYDGNEEGQYMAFTEFYCKEFDHGRFNELWENGLDFNSHWNKYEHYNDMVEEWFKSEDRFNLTKEDLLRIQGA